MEVLYRTMKSIVSLEITYARLCYSEKISFLLVKIVTDAK